MTRFPFKIFIDGGDPSETIMAEQALGFIDGQTTNPSLVAKNPAVLNRIAEGEKFSLEEINVFYKKIIEEISSVVDWSVSVEPYVNHDTSLDDILQQARNMAQWNKKVWVKLPITGRGLEAAKILTGEGIRLNMTLCFSQEQAAAVYTATSGAKNPVFISPFVGRLDDRGERGMDLIRNILKMYEMGDGHVQVLTASVRSMDHLFSAMKLGSPIITLPYKVFFDWSKKDFLLTGIDYLEVPTTLKDIPYEELALDLPWTRYNIYHDLTEAGISKFSEDWNKLLKD